MCCYPGSTISDGSQSRNVNKINLEEKFIKTEINFSQRCSLLVNNNDDKHTTKGLKTANHQTGQYSDCYV